MSERIPQQSAEETLIYATPEEARAVVERVDLPSREAAANKGSSTLKARVADELSQEFAKHDEYVDVIRTPWEHTREEHEEAQRLVDVAFRKDIGAAIRAARKSEHYPRNLDLFHDVLTGEMYDMIKQYKLDKEPIGLWVMITIGSVGVVFILVLLLFVALR